MSVTADAVNREGGCEELGGRCWVGVNACIGGKAMGLK